MTALTQGRTVKRRAGDRVALTVKSGATIFQGGVVMLDGSEAIAGTAATGKIALGIAINTAKAGETVEVAKGVFALENSASSDEGTKAQIGADCYLVDDQTVAKTNGSSSRSVVGKVCDVNDDGVWVKFD